MNRLFWAVAVAVLIAPAANAAHVDFHRGGPFGGGRFGGLGIGPGFGELGEPRAERRQTRYEDRFDELMDQYNLGLADIEDFYSSDAYFDIVDDLESLYDRYEHFLSGAERRADRLGEIISITEGNLDFYTVLLDEYASRDDLSAERLQRITDRLTHVQDTLSMRLDRLVESQDALAEALAQYETFAGVVSTYLSDVLSAGGLDSAETDEVAMSLAASELLLATTETSEAAAAALSGTADDSSVTPVPEPPAMLLAGAAALAVACWGALRGRR